MNAHNATCRIYVASLSDYNAGRLHGAWLDCDGKTADELQDEVNAMLAKSPEPVAEEYAIHDHEGFGHGLIEEYTPLSDVAAIVDVLERADDPDALLEFCEYFAADLTEADTLERFEDAYCGQWDGETEFAENLADDLGFLADVPDTIRFYFDYNAFARDLFLDGYTRTESGYVFYDYA